MMKWSIVIGPEPVNIFQSRPADGPLTSRFALLWNNYLFQIVLQVFLGMSDHDEDEFYYPDEIQISVRWPTTVTAKANCSRQKQITHGKSKSLTAKATYSRQNQIAHGKTKSLTAKPNSLTAKPNSVHRKDLGTRLERARCMVAVEDVLSELWVPYAQRGSEVLYPMWYR